MSNKQFYDENKSEEQLDYEYYLTGGKNTKNPPFNKGDIIKQKYRTDEDGNLFEGREEYEFLGMKGDMMLLKTLNTYAVYGEDFFPEEIINQIKEWGYKPKIGQTLQLHYIYADGYQLIQST